MASFADEARSGSREALSARARETPRTHPTFALPLPLRATRERFDGGRAARARRRPARARTRAPGLIDRARARARHIAPTPHRKWRACTAPRRRPARGTRAHARQAAFFPSRGPRSPSSRPGLRARRDPLSLSFDHAHRSNPPREPLRSPFTPKQQPARRRPPRPPRRPRRRRARRRRRDAGRQRRHAAHRQHADGLPQPHRQGPARARGRQGERRGV
jgi:hypothetical protein